MNKFKNSETPHVDRHDAFAMRPPDIARCSGTTEGAVEAAWRNGELEWLPGPSGRVSTPEQVQAWVRSFGKPRTGAMDVRGRWVSGKLQRQRRVTS